MNLNVKDIIIMSRQFETLRKAEFYFLLKSLILIFVFSKWYNFGIINHNLMNTKLTLSTLAIALCACANTYADVIILPKSTDAFREDYIFSDAQREQQKYKTFEIGITSCGAETSIHHQETRTRTFYKDVSGNTIYPNAGNNQFMYDWNYTINGRVVYPTQQSMINATDPGVRQPDDTDADWAQLQAEKGDGFEQATACWATNPTVVWTTVNGVRTGAYTLAYPTAPKVSEYVTDSVSGPCPGGSSGSMTVYRTHTHYLYGQKYSDTDYRATKYVNACAPLTSVTKTQVAEDSCPEGQIGRIDKTRTYSYYSDGTSKDFSDWTITGNSCVAVPTETVTPYHFEVSCDSYYGAAKGSYTGTVMKSGNNVTNSAGETTFNLISTDTTSCVKAFSNEKEIITEEACPAGQTGTRIMSVVTAENGSGTVYPNGSTPIEKSNTCVTPLDSGSLAAPESETQASAKSAVLSNMSYTVSQLSSDSDSSLLVSQLNKFDVSKSDGSAHNFNIVANSLTSKTVNAANVTKVIKAYKAASGNAGVNVKVGGLSQSLYDYVGQGGLTAQKISSEKLVMLGAKEDFGVVTVSYASYLNQMKPGDVQTFTVKIYNQ